MQVLRRIDPTRNMSRFYVLDIVYSLFGETILVRRWGRIGSTGQRLEMWFDEAAAAHAALERLLRAKTRRGYCTVQDWSAPRYNDRGKEDGPARHSS